MQDLANLRQEYSKSVLDLDSVAASPVDQFRVWFDEAIKAEILEPNAMVVGTVDSNNQPMQRTVLMKAFDDKGLVFYTNYGSRKSAQLAENPRISLLFPWYGLERQVAVTGVAEKISKAESLAYFTSRPFGSRLGAWVSQQSKVITSRSILEMKLEEMKQKFKDGKIPLPDFWGGFRVIPESFEFWQGRPNRLHDRIYYKKENEQWDISRMSP